MNPWDDIECGDHYVRAMSSWSILLAATDFGWDAHLGELRVGNRTGQDHLVAPFFAAPAWGQFEIDGSGEGRTVVIRPDAGSLSINSIVLPSVQVTSGVAVSLDGREIESDFGVTDEGVRISFPSRIDVHAGSRLRITVS